MKAADLFEVDILGSRAELRFSQFLIRLAISELDLQGDPFDSLRCRRSAVACENPFISTLFCVIQITHQGLGPLFFMLMRRGCVALRSGRHLF